MCAHGDVVAAALRPSLGMDLTGPYDVLSGRLKGVAPEHCVLHSRHYYDPPEMTTVLTVHRLTDEEQLRSGFHMGYFRWGCVDGGASVCVPVCVWEV